MEKIPHIIHYCWFGPKKPPRVERFIADWKKKLPDYTFMEWNEENTDISGCVYAREALSAGKYAFVSDYVRVKRLVEYGGVYMDTDVKIIRRFDEFLQGAGAVLSMERPGCLSTAFMAAAPGQALFAEFLASYEERHFIKSDGTEDLTTINDALTALFVRQGLIGRARETEVLPGNVYIYPPEYFSAFDMDYWNPEVTENTRVLHCAASSWHSPKYRIKGFIYDNMYRVLGRDRYRKVRGMMKRTVETEKPGETESVVLKLLGHLLFKAPFEAEAGTDWAAVFGEMKNHALALLAADMLSDLPLPEDVRRDFEDESMAAFGRNALMRYGQDDLVRVLSDAGIHFAILKGNAAGIYYPVPEYRVSGDVDVIVSGEDFERACAVLRENGFRDAFTEQNTDRHLNFEKDGIQFEVHRRFSFVNDPKTARRIDALIERGLMKTKTVRIGGSAFPVLPEALNGLVLLLHIGQHLETGLGLRQILDFLMFVRARVDDSFWERKMKPLTEAVGLTELAVTVTRLGQLYFSLPEEGHAFALSGDDKAARELMRIVLSDGNFGRKDAERVNAVRILSAGLTVRGFFGNLESAGLANWKAARRHHFLRPFAWIYQFCRYVSQLIATRHTPAGFFEEIRETGRRAVLLKKLHVTRRSRGIVSSRRDKRL